MSWKRRGRWASSAYSGPARLPCSGRPRRAMAPQKTVMEPTTVYGISKQAGEGWCRWYHANHGVDVRSMRYPGLISYKTLPGGGTTDYAVDIFHAAVKGEPYTCFLDPDEALPMMYMPDAIRATIELMEAPAERLTERGSYNIAGMTFTPAQIAAAIREHVPGIPDPLRAGLPAGDRPGVARFDRRFGRARGLGMASRVWA